MAGFLTAEGEDLVLRFRPHYASYVVRNVATSVWALYGGLVTWLALRAPSVEPWGLVILAAIVALHADLARRLHARRWKTAAVMAAIVLVAGVARLAGGIPFDLGAFDSLVAGAIFTAVDLSRSQQDFFSREYALTNRRIVVRSGFAQQTERTIPLSSVESVRAVESLWGRLFGYGTLHLVGPTKVHKRGRPTSWSEVLPGVPRWKVVKLQLEGLLDERDLSAKERARRSEERRLRESMSKLAGWARDGA